MSLMADADIPYRRELILSGRPADLDMYLRELITELQDQLRDIKTAFGGSYSWSENTGSQGAFWQPEVFGATTAGAGTYAANKQIGTVRRSDNMVELFFDVTWSAHTGTGNMYVQLPYKPITSQEKPFVGVIQDSGITYTAGTRLVMNAIQNTFRGEIWTCGDGVATGNQAITNSGQLIGYIRYMGQFYER